MSNPTRKDPHADLAPETLHVEIMLNPTTRAVSIIDNCDNDPVLFTYVLGQALATYMQKKMSERVVVEKVTGDAAPARPLVLPSRMKQ